MRSIPIVFLVLLLASPATFAADADALIRDGEAKIQAGELDAAVTVLREAVAADQTSALARLRLGGALLMKQDYSGAIEQFRETVRLDPNSANAFVGMSVAYLHSARYDLARASLDEAIRIDPDKRKEAEPLLAYIDRASARTDPASGEPAPQH
ncbi:tetratricopeptide repeat protein [Thiocapsa roseopersicina]|uniref:Tetratricopeptide repeat-containing protein n=1 Tax=Thiocapsa roseopersicina TaxID=1058 RepID=A0A1H2RN45_THIRO|nr:tetratricopeptide repeat protein [Thiocapsa roseopersicina]SDW20886.1 Tetratricopeptide repeat-containing protein [Thiocapsa roseopersicina]